MSYIRSRRTCFRITDTLGAFGENLFAPARTPVRAALPRIGRRRAKALEADKLAGKQSGRSNPKPASLSCPSMKRVSAKRPSVALIRRQSLAHGVAWRSRSVDALWIRDGKGALVTIAGTPRTRSDNRELHGG